MKIKVKSLTECLKIDPSMIPLDKALARNHLQEKIFTVIEHLGVGANYWLKECDFLFPQKFCDIVPEISPVFTLKTECEMCKTSVLAIDLEVVKIDIGNFWACDDCRKDLKNAKDSRESLGYGV